MSDALKNSLSNNLIHIDVCLIVGSIIGDCLLSHCRLPFCLDSIVPYHEAEQITILLDVMRVEREHLLRYRGGRS